MYLHLLYLLILNDPNRQMMFFQLASEIYVYHRLKKLTSIIMLASQSGEDQIILMVSSRFKDTIHGINISYSIFPPIGLAFNFFKAACHLAYFFDTKSNAAISSLWLAFYLHLSNLVFLGIIVLMGEETRKDRQLIKSSYCARQGGRRELSPSLSQAIDDLTSYQITAWNILPINRRFFFFFIGAIFISLPLIFQFRDPINILMAKLNITSIDSPSDGLSFF